MSMRKYIDLLESIGKEGYTNVVPPALKNRDILAGYRDKDGYSIYIAKITPEEMNTINPYNRIGQRGTMFIASPEGDIAKGGWWMDWPEPNWGLSKEQYKKLPEKKRAALEVKQQATNYGGLAVTFQHIKSRIEKNRKSNEQLYSFIDKCNKINGLDVLLEDENGKWVLINSFLPYNLATFIKVCKLADANGITLRILKTSGFSEKDLAKLGFDGGSDHWQRYPERK